jgi:hypothetical protein
MGRPPIGKVAMSATERWRRYRDRAANQTKPQTKLSTEDLSEVVAAKDRKIAKLKANVAELKAVTDRLQARREEAKKLPDVTPDMLSVTAQQKLDAAIRQHQRKLDMEHAARMRNLNEEVRQRVLQEGKEHIGRLQKMEEDIYEKEKWYRTLINNHKPPLTVDQYKLIGRCVHPDGELSVSPAVRHEAFILFKAKKEVLTGEPEKRRIV